MLEVARQNLAAFTNIEYHVSEGTTLPLADESVDIALANMYLHHVPDPLVAIRAMARVLKRGGRLVITDMDEHNFTWLREEQHDVWLGFDRQQIQAWFEAVDLANVSVDCTGQSCSAESQAGQGQAAVGVFVAVGTKPD
jgi:ubiquinone/menaquinone biosynthesis C-methylase UbiE